MQAEMIQRQAFGGGEAVGNSELETAREEAA